MNNMDIWNNTDISWNERQALHNDQLEAERQERETMLNPPMPTQAQVIEHQIFELKQQLLETDYKILKAYEGELLQEEFNAVKIMRRQLRQQINTLEEAIEQINN